MDDDGGTVATWATRLSDACFGLRHPALSSRVGFADGDQRIGHSLVERRSISAVTAGSGDERALDDDVLVLRERPGQGPAPIVEAKETPGEGTRGPFVGLVPSSQSESRTCLADQCVASSASLASVSGLATSTRGFTWSKESFPCESASAILGSDGRRAAAVTHSRAVAAETPHRWTSQTTIEVAPSTRHARR